MFVNKNLTFKGLMVFTGGHIIWISVWAVMVTLLFELTDWEWLTIPWLPLSVIGTAVAFYVGFKNNSAYDRLWEARKIWGAIVNSSRMWGATVRSYVSNQFRSSDLSEEALGQIHKRLFYRHIGWLYALRSQLLIPTSWEHVNQNKHVRRITIKRMNYFGTGLNLDGVTEKELRAYLPPDELQRLIDAKNTAPSNY